MTIILDNMTIPEKGTLEIHVHRTVEITITADQARKKVDHWLMEQVSTQMGADAPTFVLSEHAVWRVPAYITFPSVGRAGMVGNVDVDVKTGEINNAEETKASIEKCGAEIAKKLPPFKIQEVPAEYRTNLQPAPEPTHITFKSTTDLPAGE